MISFIGTKAFSGPNPYATQPVIVSELQINRDDEIDLETYAARMSNAFGDWWPGTTRQPEESEELFIGRYLVEWCLTTLNEIRGCLQAGGAKQVGDQVIIWLEYHNIEVSRQCLDLSAILLKKMGRKEIGLQETNKRMSHIWSECHKSHPDYQAGILIESAKLRRIPYFPIISNFQIWQFGWGSNSSLFAESISEEDSHIGNIVATNKTLGKEYFLAIGAPVGEHQLVNNEGELQSAMERVGWPCVVKPIDRGQAKGVTVNRLLKKALPFWMMA